MKMKKKIVRCLQTINERKYYKSNANKSIERFNYLHELCGISFSQNFEDVTLKKFAQEILRLNKGTYLDVGAHDPILYSNTLQLYMDGWSGINIDPLPGCKKRFDRYRKRDVNLEMGVSSTNGKMTYYSFDIPAFNSFSEESANNTLDKKLATLKEKIDIPVIRLDEILDKYLNGDEIDVMNIDVELQEMDVLLSNDWDRYKPKLIVMESIISNQKSIFDLKYDKNISFLCEKGYQPVGKIFNAVYMIDEEYIN